MSSNIFWELRDTRGNVATFPLEQLYLQDNAEYPVEIQDNENPLKLRKWGSDTNFLDNYFLKGLLNNSNPFGIATGNYGSTLDFRAYLNPVFSDYRSVSVSNNIYYLSMYYPLFIVPSSASSNEVVNDISIACRYENYIRKGDGSAYPHITSYKFFDLYVNNSDGTPKDSPLLLNFVGFYQRYIEFHKDIEDFQIWGTTYRVAQDEPLPFNFIHNAPITLNRIEYQYVVKNRSDIPSTDMALPPLFTGAPYLNPPAPVTANRLTADVVKPLMLLSKKNASVDPVWIEPRNQVNFTPGDAQICKVKLPFDSPDFNVSRTISAHSGNSGYVGHFLFYFNVYDGSWAFLLHSTANSNDVSRLDGVDTIDVANLTQLTSYSNQSFNWVSVIDSGVLSLPTGKTIKNYDILISYPQKYVRNLWEQPLNPNYVFAGDSLTTNIEKYNQYVKRYQQNNSVFGPDDITPIHNYILNQEKRDPTLWYHTTTSPFHAIDYNDQYMKDHSFNFFVGNSINLEQRGLRIGLEFTLYLRDKVTKEVISKKVKYKVNNNFEIKQELLFFGAIYHLYQHEVGNPTQIQCTNHFKLKPNSTQDYTHNMTITGYADRDYSEQINEVSPNLFVALERDFNKNTPTANSYYKYFHCKKMEVYPPTLKKITMSHDFVSRLKKDQEDTVEAILEYDSIPTNRVIVPSYPFNLNPSPLFYYSIDIEGNSYNKSSILHPRSLNIAPDFFNSSELKENFHNREFYSRVMNVNQTFLFTVERNGYIKIMAPQHGWFTFINPHNNTLNPYEIPHLREDPGYVRSLWLPDLSKETSDYEVWIERVGDVQTDYLDTSNIPAGWFSFTEDDAIKYFLIHRQYPQPNQHGPEWGKHHVNFRLHIRSKTDQVVVKQIDWAMIYESRDVEYVVDTSLGEIK